MSTPRDNALSKVQDLYLMQMELWSFLDDNARDAEKYQNAQRTLRAFKSLLKEVDWRYMGGEDVLESLRWIPDEVYQKLKKAPTIKRSSVKKVVARKEVKKRK